MHLMRMLFVKYRTANVPPVNFMESRRNLQVPLLVTIKNEKDKTNSRNKFWYIEKIIQRLDVKNEYENR